MTPLPIEQYARVLAAISAGRPRDAVLREASSSEEQWLASEVHWNRTFVEELERGADDSASAFQAAFVAAQQAIATPPSMTVEEWAALEVEVARDGVAALARRGLRSADFIAGSRHFSQLLSSDRNQARLYAEAFARASRR